MMRQKQIDEVMEQDRSLTDHQDAELMTKKSEMEVHQAAFD